MKIKFKLLIIICSIILTIIIVTFKFSTKTNFSDFALGNETVSYWAKDKHNNFVNVASIDSISSSQILNAFYHSNKDSAILILGNSQSHSINQIKSKQSTYVEILINKNFKLFLFCRYLSKC